MATFIIEDAGAGSLESRRRFTDDDKAQIVLEATMPGASVGVVSRRCRVSKSLIYRWPSSLRSGVAVHLNPLASLRASYGQRH